MKTIALAITILFATACVADQSADEPTHLTPTAPLAPPHQTMAPQSCELAAVVRIPEESNGECSARIVARANCTDSDGYMTATLGAGSAYYADTLDCEETMVLEYAVPCVSATATLCFDDECTQPQCSATANVLPSCASDLANIGDTVTPHYLDGVYTYSTVQASYGTYDCVQVGL